MANDFQIEIEDNVVLPKREANFGPRKSKYPFASMKEGQGFTIPIKGVEGVKNGKGETLTAEQDRERKARQKQSAFSASGKRLGININTRYVSSKPAEDDAYLTAQWNKHGGPFLVAVHGGAREVEEASAEENEAEQAEDAEAGSEAEDGGFGLDDE